MILAYCVVGVFTIIATATVVLYICASHHEWCVKVKKRKIVKKQVRREELFQVHTAPQQSTFSSDIGKGN